MISLPPMSPHIYNLLEWPLGPMFSFQRLRTERCPLVCSQEKLRTAPGSCHSRGRASPTSPCRQDAGLQGSGAPIQLSVFTPLTLGARPSRLTDAVPRHRVPTWTITTVQFSSLHPENTSSCFLWSVAALSLACCVHVPRPPQSLTAYLLWLLMPLSG